MLHPFEAAQFGGIPMMETITVLDGGDFKSWNLTLRDISVIETKWNYSVVNTWNTLFINAFSCRYLCH